MTKTNRPIEGEIVSAGRAIATKPVQTRDFESLAMHLQNLIQQMIETLDLTKPEGLLDRFRGVGRRIEVRIERAGQLRNLLDAFGNTIDELRTIAEKLGQLNRVAVRQQLQRLEDEYALLQAQIRIDNAHAEAHQRWRLEEARVNTEIAKLEAEAEIARRDALPPPPPPPPAPAAPPPVDQFTREKDEARRAKQQEADLNIQDTDIRADAAEKKVARARARAIEIFNNSQLNTGETRECIYAVLDEFGFDTSILPEKIRDFLKTNDTTEDYTDEVQ